MTEQRSSIRGRSSQILSGEPQAVAIAREGSDAAQVEAKNPKMISPAAGPAASMTEDGEGAEGAEGASPPSQTPEQRDLSEAELGEALYEEARAGEPDAGEGDEPWASDMEWPPTPEMELAFFEEALVAEDKARPAPEEPIPVLEETTEAMDPGLDAAGTGEPAAESGGDEPTGLPPTPPEEYYTEEEPVEEMDIQAIGEPVERVELPERTLTEAEEAQMAPRAGDLFALLNEEIDKLYQQVLDEVGVNKDITTECHNLLLKARDVVRRGDASMIAQAEYYVEQARARLRRASDSKRGARRNAWWILIWGFLWGMVFVSALFFLNAEWVRRYIEGLGLSSTPVVPEIFLSAMLWGGLGGVVAVWYSLFKHIALRDFDSTYNISYVGKPFFGLVLGASVYMIIQLAIVSLGIWPSGSTEGAGAYGIAPWIIYLLAWVSGFKENRIFGVVDLAMKRVFSGGDSAPPASTTGSLG
jgi:hypothetical protein